MPLGFSLPKYAALLICLLLLISVFPLLPRTIPSYSLEFSYDAVLVAGLLPALKMARFRTAFLVLTASTIAFRWAGYFAGDWAAIRIAASLLTIVWISAICYVMLRDLTGRTTISFDKIIGSVVVYLLISFVFTEVYVIVDILDERAFSNLRAGRETLSLLYFSMSSMAGKNFGVIGVDNDAIIAFSLLQSMIGMFFVAVLVAWLVGLNIVEWQKRSERDGDR